MLGGLVNCRTLSPALRARLSYHPAALKAYRHALSEFLDRVKLGLVLSLVDLSLGLIVFPLGRHNCPRFEVPLRVL